MSIVVTERQPTEIDGPHVRVLVDRCAGCQECVIRCPTSALSMDAARWVADVADEERCVGCRQCVRTCPFSAIEVTGPVLAGPRAATEVVHPDALVADVTEVRRGFASWEEALAEAQRCLACPDPTCVRGCPAHNDIPGFVAAVRERDLAGAHRVLRRTSVLADVCSRVCNQAAQCEGACTWSLAGDAPVAIGQLERFVADHSPVLPPEPAPPIDLSVAVVGSGPAGIGAAWELVEGGASVTVYERDPVPSGLLGWGIPDFTLPDAVASRPWVQLRAAGVDLRCGTEVDPARLEQLLVEHDAVVVATGAGIPVRLPIPGADLDGVVDATAFLKSARATLDAGEGIEEWRIAMGLPVGRGRADARPVHVLVLGAGNTAMDAARTARRLGLEATCVDWLDERYALARPDELDEARAEGVVVRFGRTVTRLEGVGPRVRRALLAQTLQTRADRPPKVLLGEPAETVEADLVVMAMGYRPDPAVAAVLPGTPMRRQATGLPPREWTASGLLANRGGDVGLLALGRETGIQAAAMPVRERTWVVGDALVGPATVVEAMAHGRRAARAMLAARPSRPGRDHRHEAGRRVLVCYASQGGHTARAAHVVGDELRAGGMSVRVLPVERVGPDELAAADVVVAGTWVEGLVVAKVGPARALHAWLRRLPRLGGVPVGVFCTYAVHPRATLATMARAFEGRGARVVASGAFGRGDAAPAASAFAAQVLTAVRSPGRSAPAP